MADELTSRASRRPSKFSDCITGNELDKLDSVINKETNITVNEDPIKHLQGDAKTNNVSFKTTRIDVWKAVIINYFGKSKTNVNNQKTGCVIKTSFDTESDKNNTVKINLFNTGSVVIQGAKCTKFADLFLDKLRYDCNNFTACLTESDDVHQTEVKSVINPSEATGKLETKILQKYARFSTCYKIID